MSPSQERTTFQCAVIVGADDDILALDIVQLNVQVFKVNSDEFRNEIRQLNPHNKRFKDNYRAFELDDYLQRLQDNAFVLYPIDRTKRVSFLTFRIIQWGLQIVFPCDLHLVSEITFDVGSENDYLWTHRATFKYLRGFVNDKPKLLSFGQSTATDVNAFLNLYFEKVKNAKYLEIAIHSYIGHFIQNDLWIAYITLMIALESITKSESEISHQLSRYCAVINSNSKQEGEVIYANMKKLYDLRSKIVHGDDKVKSEKIKAFYPTLLAITSQTLVELISHNILEKKELQSSVYSHGYGEKQQLSSRYVKLEISTDHRHLVTTPLGQ
jgi:hypothetical protein